MRVCMRVRMLRMMVYMPWGGHRDCPVPLSSVLEPVADLGQGQDRSSLRGFSSHSGLG